MKSNQKDTVDYVQMGTEAGASLLTNVHRFNWVLLPLLTAAAWYMFSWKIAQSVLIGGLLANASFFMLRQDITRFMANFGQAGMNWKAVKQLEKVKFFLKFYGRLIVLAVILYFLITRVSVDVIGLVVGLSTVMLSVIVVVLSKGSMLLSAQGFKGA